MIIITIAPWLSKCSHNRLHFYFLKESVRWCCRVLSGFSHVWLFATPGTTARQAPLSRGFSRQEYWRGLPCPPPGDLPNPEIEPMFYISCIGRQVLYHQHHLESPRWYYWSLSFHSLFKIIVCKLVCSTVFIYLGKICTSLVVLWLRLQAPNAKGPNMIPS